MKHLQLTLTKISYGGNSIGDDIRIEIDCLNYSLDFNKTIKNKSEARIDKVVGEFFTDQPTFSLPLSVRVIERDLVFNDVGIAQETFVVDTQRTSPQSFTAKVAIQEMRNYQSTKKAVFEIAFEVKIMDAIMYVKYQNNGDGWLKVAPERSEEDFSIPFHFTYSLSTRILKLNVEISE